MVIRMAKRIIPRFPEYEWYCASCKENLNNQAGFNDNKFTWVCKNCSYKNSISKDNLRKPYACLKDTSIKNRFLRFIIGTWGTIYGLIFRTALYCTFAAVAVVALHQTTIEHLSLGIISPRDFEDYFCVVLSFSWIVVLVQLLLYALSKRIFGRPDIKKHFIRETLYFLRDTLLYPLKLIKSLFDKTTVISKVQSVLALFVMIMTIGVIVYGCLNWL